MITVARHIRSTLTVHSISSSHFMGFVATENDPPTINIQAAVSCGKKLTANKGQEDEQHDLSSVRSEPSSVIIILLDTIRLDVSNRADSVNYPYSTCPLVVL